MDRRLKIIIGAYGSGKSEISVNLALEMRKTAPEDKILLADLDIVNPFTALPMPQGFLRRTILG